MDYIVLDIEFNGRKFASNLPMEVIEIGAVRLNSQLEIIDTYASFIKPVYFAKLNPFIQNKTGIPQESIDNADRFPKVIRSFLSWLGHSEEVMFVTWGGEDIKRIVLDTRMHKLDDQYWMNTPYLDLLKSYIRYKGFTNDVSVEGALAQLELDSTGSAHRALDDAIMTADIFRAVYEHIDLSRAQLYEDKYTNAKERRGIKNAIRLLRAQKLEPTWDNYVTKFLKEKITTEDPRKIAEVKAYFEAESAKPVKMKPFPVNKEEQAHVESAGERNSESEDQLDGKRDCQSESQCEDNRESVGEDQLDGKQDNRGQRDGWENERIRENFEEPNNEVQNDERQHEPRQYTKVNQETS